MWWPEPPGSVAPRSHVVLHHSVTPPPPVPPFPTFFHFVLHCPAGLQTTGSALWNAPRCVSPITSSLPAGSLHLARLSFSRSLMDLALFFFCFLLQPWNSPSGEKAVFRDASLHLVNIVGAFLPLFSASLQFSLELYRLCIVSAVHWADASVTLKSDLWVQWRRAMKHVIMLNSLPASFLTLFRISC